VILAVMAKRTTSRSTTKARSKKAPPKKASPPKRAPPKKASPPKRAPPKKAPPPNKAPGAKPAPVAKGAPAALLPLDPAARARVRAAHEHEAKVSTLQSPAELHYLARYWNWDEGLDALRDIVNRPDCALATAMHVLWHSLPDEVIGLYATRDEAEDEDGAGEVYDLALAICIRAAAGGYADHGIGYDPTNVGGTDLTANWDPAAAKHAIPTVLMGPVHGRVLDPAIKF